MIKENRCAALRYKKKTNENQRKMEIIRERYLKPTDKKATTIFFTDLCIFFQNIDKIEKHLYISNIAVLTARNPMFGTAAVAGQ